MVVEKTVRMLSGLGTSEVSVVRRAANRKRFAFTKSEDSRMTLDPIKAVVGTQAEGEDLLIAALKTAGADEKRVEACVAAYRIQKGFADVMKPSDFEAIAKAAKGKKADYMMEDEEDADEELKNKKKAKKSENVDLSALTPETQAQVQAIFKSHEALEAKSSKLEEIVKTLVDAGQTREFVAKAERDFSHVPGSPSELAAVLKSAHDANPKLAEGLEKILKSVNELVAKSALLGAVGVSGGAAPAGSAMHRLEAMAGQLTQKADNGKPLSKEQRMDRVLKTAEGAALYREYLAENPTQRAAHNF
jgi:hypothetical protein